MAPFSQMRCAAAMIFGLLAHHAHAQVARPGVIIDWVAPAGKYTGGCRTGTPGVNAHVGRFDEHWAIPETTCREKCAVLNTCLAYEWVQLPQGYSRCELHKEPVTHVVPVDGSFCFTKRVRGSGMSATPLPGRPTWDLPPPPVRVVVAPPPPPHPCGPVLVPNGRVEATPECPDLMNADLRGMDLKGATFNVIDCTGANFVGANLAGATFSLSTLDKANFSRAILAGASITGPTSLIGADFSNANASGITITDVISMTNVNFTETNLDKANLAELGESLDAKFDRATLRGATVMGAVFMGTSTFKGTNFETAKINLLECDGCVMNPSTSFKGIDPLSSDNDFSNSQMSGIDLSGLKLTFASFENSKLDRSNFAGTKFSESSFFGANLTRANFAAADCTLTEFNMADVSYASFVGATLTESSFVEATITNADFTGATGTHTCEFAASKGTATGIPPSPPI